MGENKANRYASKNNSKNKSVCYQNSVNAKIVLNS